MKNFLMPKIQLTVIMIGIIALSTSCDHFDPPIPERLEIDEPLPEVEEESKCFTSQSAWAIGFQYSGTDDNARFIEVPIYQEDHEEKEQIKWVYLESVTTEEYIGAVKFKELDVKEMPEGAEFGEYVKMLVRIDDEKWYFGSDVENVKVQGFEVMPTPEELDPGKFTTHIGVAEVATGVDWEYYEVILKRFPYYSIYIGAKLEVDCD
ncbi:hypothetical protein IFO69_16310 [Echinicola sp. CAU 1574]|uniref:Uncharacterized protein n=1 Tax=Echinicola arenosa TaxID=2774144 RepID=A0ABR9ANE0_9BACT|nr:hypothetical protein [Echinicola arenosa]MBD8490316.1 hypothetical protein [Echinicola arenosa]